MKKILSLALIFVSSIYIAINKRLIMNMIITCCHWHQCVPSNIGYQNHCKIDLLNEIYVFDVCFICWSTRVKLCSWLVAI